MCLAETDQSGLPKRVDLQLELFLRTMPDGIRSKIPEPEHLSTQALITLADNLVDAAKAEATGRSQHKSSHIAHASLSMVSDKVSAINTVKVLPKRKDRPARLGALNQSSICGYHERFGRNAHKCINGCRWMLVDPMPKNESAGLL